MNKKIFAMALALVALVACETAKRADQKGQFTRSITVVVDGVSRQPVKAGQVFFIERTDSDLRTDEADAQLARALELSGFKQALDQSKAEVIIHAEYGVEKPVTGISIGILSPFKHSVVVKASKAGKAVWETRITGPSEFEDRRGVLPVILAGAVGEFGKSTDGPVRFEVQEKDETVLKIKAR